MWTLIAIPATCWICALVALPRRPRLGVEVEELVYARLLGKHQRLVLLAILMTGVTLLALPTALPRHADTDLPTARPCWIAAPEDQPVCDPG
jgi:hypothetical protein